MLNRPMPGETRPEQIISIHRPTPTPGCVYLCGEGCQPRYQYEWTGA